MTLDTGSRALMVAIAAAAAVYAQIQNQPDDGQWVMAAKNYASTRFSTLDQISTGNARRPLSAWL